MVRANEGNNEFEPTAIYQIDRGPESKTVSSDARSYEAQVDRYVTHPDRIRAKQHNNGIIF